MTKHIVLVLISSVTLFAQAPNLSGIWQADLQASKLEGPPITSYRERIVQNGPLITETMLTMGGHGEARSQLAFTTDGKPTIRPYNGVPSRETAAVDNSALVVTIETAGRPDVSHRKYELSSDSQTLTITADATANSHQMHNQVVLHKQPDSAGADFDKPGPSAADVFKNLKTPLKTLSATDFIDQMHYFAWALNKNCSFCHVQGHFDSDEKDEKRTARTMISMVGNINTNFFNGKEEVKCFTCHEFREHPQSRPQFEGEPEEHHHHHDEAAEHADHDHAGPPPPPQ